MRSLSVIVPVRNGADHLSSTLAALAAQTVPPHEVIVVDDGSTDDSGAIAASFTFSNGSHPAVIRQDTQQGVAIARNHGVFVATGEWVAMCDADDLWHPRRIEYLQQASRVRTDAHAIATGSIGFALYQDQSQLEGHQRARMVSQWVPDDDLVRLTALVDQHDIPYRDVTLDDLQQNIVFATTTVCYRRESYALVGGGSVFAFHADNHLLNASIATLGPILYLDGPLVFYRVRPGSESHDEAAIAAPFLTAALSISLGGRKTDPRPAGPLYRHMVGVLARQRVRRGTILGFCLLGRLGIRPTLSVLKRSWSPRRR